MLENTSVVSMVTSLLHNAKRKRFEEDHLENYASFPVVAANEEVCQRGER